MGQTLSAPVTDKETTSGGDKKFIYGASSMQGWRISMEDAHTTLLEADLDNKASFFAVFDGHGGTKAAIYSGENLHKLIFETEAFGEGDYEEALRQGFLTTDEEFRKTTLGTIDHSGCTAVCVLITPDGHLYCGNAGDSRAILDEKSLAVELSFDHKPGNPEEYSRIIKGGGTVEYGRVNGNLALSRAIGDFDFKGNRQKSAEEQIVTALPDVLSRKITPDDDFIVLACDGIWDCLTNQEVVHFVRRAIANGSTLDKACEELMHKCLAGESEMGGVGCDNMTVIIVGLLQGKTENEWYDHIKNKVFTESIQSESDIEQSLAAEELEKEALVHTPSKGAHIAVLKTSEEETAADSKNSKDDSDSSTEEPADSSKSKNAPAVVVDHDDDKNNVQNSSEEKHE